MSNLSLPSDTYNEGKLPGWRHWWDNDDSQPPDNEEEWEDDEQDEEEAEEQDEEEAEEEEEEEESEDAAARAKATPKTVGWLYADTNECDFPKEDIECYGECTNTQGSFECSCPQGTGGNYTLPNGCVEPPKPSKTRNTGLDIGIGLGSGAAAIVVILSFTRESRRQARHSTKSASPLPPSSCAVLVAALGLCVAAAPAHASRDIQEKERVMDSDDEDVMAALIDEELAVTAATRDAAGDDEHDRRHGATNDWLVLVGD
ncbi:hypothetical protein QYE76_036282 [Lolium multiflorum]|uniref:EGF-like calcium-binding domain-containing protein n=1 Tax=Lolium multiflorum TaxID=4521 RepID=A0AAD8R3B3_LOLMU|nr:hypothetical protein QYE76_036282 [Lolium multiflorum]